MRRSRNFHCRIGTSSCRWIELHEQRIALVDRYCTNPQNTTPASSSSHLRRPFHLLVLPLLVVGGAAMRVRGSISTPTALLAAVDDPRRKTAARAPAHSFLMLQNNRPQLLLLPFPSWISCKSEQSKSWGLGTLCSTVSAQHGIGTDAPFARAVGLPPAACAPSSCISPSSPRAQQSSGTS